MKPVSPRLAAAARFAAVSILILSSLAMAGCASHSALPPSPIGVSTWQLEGPEPGLNGTLQASALIAWVGNASRATFTFQASFGGYQGPVRPHVELLALVLENATGPLGMGCTRVAIFQDQDASKGQNPTARVGGMPVADSTHASNVTDKDFGAFQVNRSDGKGRFVLSYAYAFPRDAAIHPHLTFDLNANSGARLLVSPPTRTTRAGIVSTTDPQAPPTDVFVDGSGVTQVHAQFATSGQTWLAWSAVPPQVGNLKVHLTNHTAVAFDGDATGLASTPLHQEIYLAQGTSWAFDARLSGADPNGEAYVFLFWADYPSWTTTPPPL